MPAAWRLGASGDSGWNDAWESALVAVSVGAEVAWGSRVGLVWKREYRLA